ncbi:MULTISPECIES: GNAT family N-acetyltransferase [unclassified Corynebacterium]|uniref:GNAT family N-acetyltransferase n=1 Tax=unclassified Corynebacterium TaxID=2624378 RepID=UPI002655291C|nr:MULTISPECIES: GNAT family N-acetyltransferase [unclassified Corynebacterium]MDN8595091.1 GNAT family N-acetyltransferase [Corynebacterium sp. P4_F2]WKK55475.1 GNAT family N-acetyltransferase [Corynebacterium sp. P4-C1]WKK62886.1 GNAT family N-acetyltransferase [Corynebacterium sp. P8-C1]
MAEQNFDVEHREADKQYVINVDGERAGFADYRDADETTRDFNHTVIDPKFRGQGLSGKLVKAALDDTRTAGKKIIPTCSAVEHFVEKNADYKDLVA